MATDYGARFSKAVGCTRHAMGGAAEGLGIEALAGDTAMVTVFDDFNGVIEADAFGVGTTWETLGWEIADVGGGAQTGDYIEMNDCKSQVDFDSSIVIVPGDTADLGGNCQLDKVTGDEAAGTAVYEFPHMWIPSTGSGVTVLDDTTWVFATRVGFQSGDATAIGAASGDWNGKTYIGWAVANDVNVMTNTTGAIVIASTGGLVGFHVTESGDIRGISHRTAATAMAEGTNYTTLLAAGGVDGNTGNGATSANQKMWFDLAVKLDITDMDDDDDNGYSTFYWRRVLPSKPLGDWMKHPTVLENQTPNSATVMVPTIEVINGPAVVQECAVGIDWWAFARNRVNR